MPAPCVPTADVPDGWIAAAFCATDGGSDGPTSAAVGCAPPGARAPATAGVGAGGGRVRDWPLALVTVTVFVVLLTITVLWTLL